MAVEAILTGADQFSDVILLQATSRLFNVSVDESGGAFVATVTLQRSFDGEVTWRDVVAFQVASEMIGENPELKVPHRIGIKTGDYSSGNVYVRLGENVLQ